MPLTVGVDVGGTFTDVVVFDGDVVTGRKLLTTPDQSVAVAEALVTTGVGGDSVFLHGTTAGTNALLEGRGARTALVTTPGFEDLIEIGRQARPALYDSFADRPPPLVERSLRFAIDDDIANLIELLQAVTPQSVAVALVRSYLDPEEELAVADTLRSAIGVPVSVGARVSPAFREYERIASTVLNAYLTPEVAGYLGRLDAKSNAGRRLVMTSAGGLLPFAAASEYAGRLVLSGPAAGVVAAAELGKAKGHASVISFDMGGTSTDVCRITGGDLSPDSRRGGAGWVNRVPSLPVRTIGAGGGSLAWVDVGGALRVGPKSAGANPGPAVYGLGGKNATVTDANVVLGRIPPESSLGGSVSLDVTAAWQVMTVFGSALGLDAGSAAGGIIDVVDAHMERALRAVSVEEGVDPRDSALVAFGGAGGLHSSRLARRLGMRTTLVPPFSGVFSALGLLLARPSSDAVRTVMLEEGSPRLGSVAESIVAEAADRFDRDHGVVAERVESWGEMRYFGQSHELTAPLCDDWLTMRNVFEAEHHRRFGFVQDGQPIELVNVRAVVWGRAPMVWSDLRRLSSDRRPEAGSTLARVESREIQVPVWERAELPPGFETEGPAIVVETDSATWLEPDDRVVVHADGTLEIHS